MSGEPWADGTFFQDGTGFVEGQQVRVNRITGDHRKQVELKGAKGAVFDCEGARFIMGPGNLYPLQADGWGGGVVRNFRVIGAVERDVIWTRWYRSQDPKWGDNSAAIMSTRCGSIAWENGIVGGPTEDQGVWDWMRHVRQDGNDAVFAVRRVAFLYAHDDGENDTGLPIVEVDGCYVLSYNGFSLRPGRNSSGNANGRPYFVINTLMELYPCFGNETKYDPKDGKLHACPFKLSGASNDILLDNFACAIGQPNWDHRRTFRNSSWGSNWHRTVKSKIKQYGNSVLLYLPDAQDFDKSGVSSLGFEVVQGREAQQELKRRKAQFIMDNPKLAKVDPQFKEIIGNAGLPLDGMPQPEPGPKPEPEPEPDPKPQPGVFPFELNARNPRKVFTVPIAKPMDATKAILVLDVHDPDGREEAQITIANQTIRLFGEQAQGDGRRLTLEYELEDVDAFADGEGEKVVRVDYVGTKGSRWHGVAVRFEVNEVEPDPEPEPEPNDEIERLKATIAYLKKELAAERDIAMERNEALSNIFTIARDTL